ncbi:MAG: GMP synthase subunit A [Methanomassiliicoccales archaeon]|nr:GMP synthase subunit A [Methanomassiliicoccales archaeon]NYT15963.1 GMP synthase subunit A [Methanomassiliicoccales archaeon]
MKVFVVDNGGQWTHREWRVLRYLKVDTKIVPNDTPFEEIEDVDGLVLSGGAPRVAMDTARMGRNGEYLDRADFPILGICAGLHFMAGHFGGSTGPAKVPEYGKTTLFVDEEDDLFLGLPREFTVWESHNDEVKELPLDFEVLAHSDSCSIQAVKMHSRPIYGLQFHPEVENTEHGYEIFKNFLRVVEEWHS